MKVNVVAAISAHVVETSERELNVYTRYGANSWFQSMGESDEPVYDAANLEKAFQDFMAANPSIANARLIASAPELLEALQGLLLHFVTKEAYPEFMADRSNDRFIDMATAETKARLAIAKATGK